VKLDAEMIVDDMNGRTALQGDVVFDFRKRFSVRRTQEAGTSSLVFRDSLSPASACCIGDTAFHVDTKAQRLQALRMFMPPCVAPAPLYVRNLPDSAADIHFWQFPAITEKLAFENHATLGRDTDGEGNEAPVQTYLGLPWATYIDTQCVPDIVKQVFRVRLQGYRALASAWGLEWGHDIRIHTVCQHIYWQALLPVFSEIGVTDLHLSHCEPASGVVAQRYGVRVHSWSLAAPNIVNPARRTGLETGRKPAARNKLASFVGAHMPHYRSDIRLRLKEEAARTDEPDLVYELTSDWHFNPVVYDMQVKGKTLSSVQLDRERDATARYNTLLSDSVFSLCPEGAGPNTLRLWESLAAGAIPVVIVDDWLWPAPPEGSPRWEDAVIVLRRNEVAGVFERLRRLRQSEPVRLERMQSAGRILYEGFCQKCCF